ncbi:MAG: DUF6754 domain-containing protein [Anaerolineales bacterium]
MTLLPLGFLFLFIVLIVSLNFLVRQRGARNVALREVDALQSLPGMVGAAVESGKRLHLSLGNGALGQSDTATVLAGLTAASQIAAVAVVSDKAPLVTTTDGAAMLLAEDVMKSVYVEQNAADRYEGDVARVAALSPASFGAAMTTLVSDEAVSGNVLIGPVGAESVLLAEAGRRAGATTLAGTDNVAAQAALFAAADHSLIGEDVYATGAYLSREDAHVASLQAQDIIRWLLVAVIVGGALARTLGLLP